MAYSIKLFINITYKTLSFCILAKSYRSINICSTLNDLSNCNKCLEASFAYNLAKRKQ
jgi:hypothetical protein